MVALLAATPAFGAPSAIASKEAQVQLVLGQIQTLDVSLERAVEAYDAATGKLQRIQANLQANKRHLALAKKNLRRSQLQLARHLVAMYTSGDDNSAMSVLLGATSLDDFLSRVDYTNRVSHQEAVIHHEVVRYRAQVQREHKRLAAAKEQQREVVRERAAHRASVEQQLAERRQLVASIQSEIVRLRAEERRREAAAAAAARRRLAAAARHPRLPAQVVQPVATHASASAPAPAPAPAPSPAPEPAPAPAPAPVAVAPPAPAPSGHGDVVSIAMRYLGTPYVWGGASPSGFDCSGLVMYVFAQVGISLPHNAAAQYSMGSPVSRSDLQPGDLVFFAGLGHVGIYIGGGQFVHAPHTGDVVKISSMTGWYSSEYVGARRI